MMGADEMMALTAYTEYIAYGISSMETKFFDKFVTKEAEDGSIYREYIEGYDSFTWQDIKELEINDPEGYMEFL